MLSERLADWPGDPGPMPIAVAVRGVRVWRRGRGLLFAAVRGEGPLTRTGRHRRPWLPVLVFGAALGKLPVLMASCLDIELGGSDDETITGSSATIRKSQKEASRREVLRPGGRALPGTLVTREFNLADFSAIEISHAFDVELTRSERFSVVVTVDDNVLEHVSAEKVGRSLRLRLDGASTRNAVLRASIGMPAFDALSVSGASRIKIGGFGRLDKVRVVISGASRVTGEMEAADLELDSSGAGHAGLAGSAISAAVRGSGASGFDLADFTIATARVELSGASSAEMTVAGELTDVRMSGASRLRYHGSPSIGSASLSGGSSLTGD